VNDVDISVGLGDEEKDRNFITALARGLDILRCFRPNEIELTNQDFAQRTGLPKPTVSRLTHTLCVLEYLVLDARTGTYRLGAGVLKLGFGVLSAMDMGDRARDVMRELSRGPNTYITVALGERHQSDVVYVGVERSLENVSLSLSVGTRLPVFDSAIGRAILVGLRADDREAIFEQAGRADPVGDKQRRTDFITALAQYETNGYCHSYGEWRADVNGIAVPVRSLGGGRVYGLNVGGPSFHVKKKQLEGTYAKLLLDAAQRLSGRN
jgi:DNA-binding IclR family transcriptional regulator